MSSWIERVRDWTSVEFKDPQAQAERVMVRVLLLAAAALTLAGIADIARSRSVASSVQFVFGLVLVAIALWMDRTGRAHPRTILVIASLASYFWIVLTVRSGEYLRLTDASPTVVITFTGVLALILGGRWVRWVVGFWAVLIVVAVVTTRWPVTHSWAHVATDATTVLTITALAAIAAMTIRRAILQGQHEYQRLLETAPVAVIEVNTHELHKMVTSKGITDPDQFLDALRQGILTPNSVAESVRLASYNDVAISDLAIGGSDPDSTPLKNALLADSSREIMSLIGRMLFESGGGSAEFAFGPDRSIHRVINWNPDSRDRHNFIVTATDISAQKLAEKALADEIKYKDEFIASVSHELRTPLTAVVGLVDELSRTDSAIPPEEKDELMSIAAEQSHEVADIVEDLLVAARAAGGNLSTSPIEFDLTETISSTLVLFDDSFEWNLEDELWAYADPSRVRQIIRNLASNAIRYGGTERRVEAITDGEVVVIEVRDNGEPIAPEKRELMFQPYERARQSIGTRPESVGLGLTVAQSLARAMAGELSYEHDGDESVFRLILPADKTPA